MNMLASLMAIDLQAHTVKGEYCKIVSQFLQERIMIWLDENIVFNTLFKCIAKMLFCFTNQTAGFYLLALMIFFSLYCCLCFV